MIPIVRQVLPIILSVVVPFTTTVLVTADFLNTSHNVALRVRDAPFRKVGACQQPVTNFELLNLDEEEPVTIHSVQTFGVERVDMVTDLRDDCVRTTDLELGPHVSEDDVLIEQVDTRGMPSLVQIPYVDQAISLEPGRSAVLLVRFLPRFPPKTYLDHRRIIESKAPQMPLSEMERTDLGYLVGEEAIWYARHERAYHHLRELSDHHPLQQEDSVDHLLVTTQAVVHHSRGQSTINIWAESYRYNAYGIPARISFLPLPPETLQDAADNPHGLLLDILEFGKKASRRARLLTEDERTYPKISQRHRLDRHCQDIFVSNPLDEGGMSILEVSVSMPQHVSLFYRPDDDEVPLIGPTNIIDTWPHDQEGGFYLPEAEDGVYVVTVCLIPVRDAQFSQTQNEREYGPDPKSIAFPEHEEGTMGYVQIRTDEESLFVVLDVYPVEEEEQQQQQHQQHRTTTTLKPMNAYGEEPPSLAIFPTVTGKDMGGTITSISFSLWALNEWGIDVGPPGSGGTVSEFAIENLDDVPIKIMQISLGFFDDDPNAEDKMLEGFREVGLSVGLRMLDGFCQWEQSSSSGDCEGAEQVRPPCSQIEERDPEGYLKPRQRDGQLRFGVAAMVDQAKAYEYINKGGSSKKRLHFSGQMIVRASREVDLGFGQWKRKMQAQPYREPDMVLSIPITVDIVQPKNELFLERTTTSQGLNNPLKHEERAINNLLALRELSFPIKPMMLDPWLLHMEKSFEGYPSSQEDGFSHEIIATTTIADEREAQLLAVAAYGNRAEDDDECAGLFETWHTDEFELSNKTKFQNTNVRPIGTIGVEFLFPKAPLSKNPLECALGLETRLIRHFMPMSVFSGMITVNNMNGDHGDGTVEMGFDKLLTWMDESSAGAGFARYLKQRIPRGRMEQRLRKYIAGIADLNLTDSRWTTTPVLVKGGAVGEGEETDTYAYFRNNNPVPVTVYLDVSEVEGAGIVIDRERARGIGDGNSLIDHLPTESNLQDKPELNREKSPFASHSIEGLRRFLIESPVGREAFEEITSFRESIVQSNTRRRDNTRLYNRYARTKFHATRLPRHTLSHATTNCVKGSTFPAGYYNLTTDTGHRFPSPLLLSDDLSIVHHSIACDAGEYGPANAMKYKQLPITIPAGGTARFRVLATAPDVKHLHKDITPLVSAGLVLRTDHGQVIPIFIAFETLVGQLVVTKGPFGLPSPYDTYGMPPGIKEIIDIPMGVNFTYKYYAGLGSISTDIRENTGSTATPLFLHSSFDRQVIVKDVTSCNPWFEIDLKNETTSVSGSRITNYLVGTVRSSVLCPIWETSSFVHDYASVGEHAKDISEASKTFPSFYVCALEWLTRRESMQPHGCGLERNRSYKDARDKNIDEAIERAVAAASYALALTAMVFDEREIPEEAVGEGGILDESAAPSRTVIRKRDKEPPLNVPAVAKTSVRGHTIIDGFMLNAYSEVLDSWRAVTDLGLNDVTSTLSATVEFESEENSRSRSENLSVMMDEMALRTSLDMPMLFDFEEVKRRSKVQLSDDDPFLPFPPVEVATTSAAYIPIRNPTSVPVRVSLAVAPMEPRDIDDSDDVEDDGDGMEESVTRFLEENGPIYAQGHPFDDNPGGKGWWDGHGGFFMPDNSGNLLFSKQNRTITAGGAYGQVTLVDPTVFATSALLVAGGRPGNSRPSDLGASAAATVTLSGRTGKFIVGSSRTPTAPVVGKGEPLRYTGGSTNQSQAIEAFAVPYSAFDEIVVPPNGTAELGPILFRPPGETAIFGCDVMDMDMVIWGGKKQRRSCSTLPFRSIVLLENSLTGLERIAVRGKALRRRIVFVDPPLKRKQDHRDYSNIEYRFGRSALMFSGSSKEGSASFWETTGAPATKSVWVQNDGDVEVEFSDVYLSATTRTAKTRSYSLEEGGGCELHGFALLQCSSDDSATITGHNKRVKNLRHGFKLPPGKGLGLRIQHVASCTHQSDYVTLNLEYKRSSWADGSLPGSRDPIARSATLRQRRTRLNDRLLSRDSEQALIGYDMDAAAMRACVPSSVSKARNATKTVFFFNLARPWSIRLVSFVILGVVGVLACACAWWTTRNLIQSRERTSTRFATILRGAKVRRRFSGSASDTPAYINWAATFRCLARADPTAAELQTLGRDQVRHIVHVQFKTAGVNAPQCINSTGMFVRDRSSVLPGRTDEKIRTLSDSIFSRLDLQKDESVGVKPCALGWRAAAERGVNVSSTAHQAKMKSVALREERAKARREAHIVHQSRREQEARRVESETEYDDENESTEETSEESTTVASLREEDDSLATGGSLKDTDSLTTGSLRSYGSKSRRTVSSASSRRTSEEPVPSKPPEPRRNRDSKKASTAAVSVETKKEAKQAKKAPTKQTTKPVTVEPSKPKPAERKATTTKNPNKGKKTDQTQKKEANDSKASRKKTPTEKSATKPAPTSKKQSTGKREKGSSTKKEEKAKSKASQRQKKKGSDGKNSTPSASPSVLKTLRPPPGLPPPPGFGTVPAVGGAKSEEQSTSALLDSLPRDGGLAQTDEIPPSNESLSLLAGLESSLTNLSAPTEAALGQLYSASATSLGQGAAAPVGANNSISDPSASASSLFGSRSLFGSAPGEQLSRSQQIGGDGDGSLSSLLPQQPLEPALASLGTSFNVMDFLDNILEEPSSSQIENEDSLLSQSASQEQAQTNPTLSAVSLNPWAPQSRASRFGIALEEDDGNADEPEILDAILATTPRQPTDANSSVPLLTPSAILETGRDAGDDDGKGNSYGLRASFYSNLLGEEE